MVISGRTVATRTHDHFVVVWSLISWLQKNSPLLLLLFIEDICTNEYIDHYYLIY